MKATEFVEKYGIEFAKKWFVKNVGDTPTHQKYVNIVDGEPKGIISTASYGGFHVDELKRLIISHELVREHFTPDRAKEYADSKYTAPEVAERLKQAIIDVEACQ